jgi:LPS sulfotransferase NodH
MSAPSTIPLPTARRRQKWTAARVWLELQKLRNEIRLQRHWWLRPHTPYQPLFVLATHRSGSNLLIDYLNRTGDIACHSEVLCNSLPYAPLGRYSPARAIAHLRRSLQTLPTPVRGCKLMLDQLADCRLGVPELIAAFPTARFVVLYRQSLAEQYLSLKTARVTNQWVLRPGQAARATRVPVERHDLRAYCERIKAAYRQLLESQDLRERAVLLSYEELTAEPAYWLRDQICPLVDAPCAQAATDLLKQNTRPLADRVENYRQVEALLLSPLCQQSYVWPGQRQSGRRAA